MPTTWFVWKIYFNPRSREGSDSFSFLFSPVVADFNPRSREGSDSFSFLFFPVVADFNPRSREGSDIFFGFSIVFIAISIHAPAKGATIFWL